MNESEPSISAVGAHLVDEKTEIAALAYRFYDEEGRPEGKAEEHWLRAEQEVRGRRGNDQRPEDDEIKYAEELRDLSTSV